MAVYDLRCSFCNYEIIDRFEPVNTTTDERGPCPKCTAHALERVWLTKPPTVIGDETDIWIKHGLCDEQTGQPKHYTSKQEIAREAKRRGMVNVVEHVGRAGGDRSKHTSRWV